MEDCRKIACCSRRLYEIWRNYDSITFLFFHSMENYAYTKNIKQLRRYNIDGIKLLESPDSTISDYEKLLHELVTSLKSLEK